MMGFGMLLALPLMILVPLVVMALPALGLVWLVRGTNPLAGQPVTTSSAPTAVCPKCHRGVQVGWHNCAYCGQELS